MYSIIGEDVVQWFDDGDHWTGWVMNVSGSTIFAYYKVYKGV